MINPKSYRSGSRDSLFQARRPVHTLDCPVQLQQSFPERHPERRLNRAIEQPGITDLQYGFASGPQDPMDLTIGGLHPFSMTQGVGTDHEVETAGFEG